MNINRYRKLLFVVLLLIAFSACQLSPVSDETKRLEGLSKVWGFLKYYHPEVASGVVQWDSVLVNTIPKVQEAQSKEVYNRAIRDLLELAGDVEPCDNCTVTEGDSLISLVDFSWMDSPLFTSEISGELKFIKNNKQPFDNYYVQPSNLNDARFPEEKPYAGLENPDVNYRLLALFRYWNAIEYFYPYKNLTDLEWEKVLRKMIPVFIEAEGGYEYYLTVRKLQTYLNDGHASVSGSRWDSRFNGGNKQPPFYTMKINNQIVVSSFKTDSLEKSSSVKVGDVITYLNGEPIENRFKYFKKHLSGANEAQQTRDILLTMVLSDKDTGELTILRGDSTINLEFNYYTYNEIIATFSLSAPQSAWEMKQNGIGYVDLRRVQSNEIVQEIFQNLMDSEVLIVDVRGYPPFMPFFEFISYLFEDEYPSLVLFTQSYFDMPGYFVKRGAGNELHKEVLVPLKEKTYSGHLVLLVNEFTQSRAEFFTAILQNYPRVTTVGNRTAGSDGNVTSLVLPGGIRTSFTGAGVFYADGTVKQRKGVKVEVVVQPTLQGIKEGKDEVLDQAIDWAMDNNQKNKAGN